MYEFRVHTLVDITENGNLKKEFPVTSQYIHLNTAGSGLMSETVLDFRQEHDLDYLIQGSILKDKQGAFLAKVRETVANFFHCESDNVALVPNFSIGLNMLLEGLPEKSKILLLISKQCVTVAVNKHNLSISPTKSIKLKVKYLKVSF